MIRNSWWNSDACNGSLVIELCIEYVRGVLFSNLDLILLTVGSIICFSDAVQALPIKACATNVCQYQYTYGDQSNTNGDLAFETISFNNGAGTKSVPNFAFGCGTQNLGTFAGAGGLVGLGQGPLSLNSQLSSSFSNKFSYCLVSLNSAAASPLTFGSVDAAANIQYTSIVANPRHPTYYYVELNSIEIGGQPLNLASSVFAIDQSTGRGGTIIDSGTTITMLTMPAYNAVLQVILFSTS